MAFKTEFFPGADALDGSRVLKHAVVDPERYCPRHVNALQAGITGDFDGNPSAADAG